ncbi:MAG: Hsp20/alpha crystallin family protein [Chthoniobacterales bacterium]
MKCSSFGVFTGADLVSPCVVGKPAAQKWRGLSSLLLVRRDTASRPLPPARMGRLFLTDKFRTSYASRSCGASSGIRLAIETSRWANLRDEFNNLFEGSLWPNTRQAQLFNGWTPALDLSQTNDDVIALVELPGMRKEEIEISLQDGTLTIAGERKNGHEEGDKNERTERFVGKFCRTVTLPTRVDSGKVNAGYRDGILTVTLPKAEDVKPKQIQINAD